VPDIEECLRQVMAVQGALGASVFDYPSGSPIGAAGNNAANNDLEVASTDPVRLVDIAVQAAAFTAVSRPERVEEIIVTADSGYHVIHLLTGRLGLYVWLDRVLGNLALTQRAMRSVGVQLTAAR
jgi:hypothetical protein